MGSGSSSRGPFRSSPRSRSPPWRGWRRPARRSRSARARCSCARATRATGSWSSRTGASRSAMRSARSSIRPRRDRPRARHAAHRNGDGAHPCARIRRWPLGVPGRSGGSGGRGGHGTRRSCEAGRVGAPPPIPRFEHVRQLRRAPARSTQGAPVAEWDSLLQILSPRPMHLNVPSGDRWCRFLRASVVSDRMSRERLPPINCCITAAFSPVNSARSGASARTSDLPMSRSSATLASTITGPRTSSRSNALAVASARRSSYSRRTVACSGNSGRSTSQRERRSSSQAIARAGSTDPGDGRGWRASSISAVRVALRRR